MICQPFGIGDYRAITLQYSYISPSHIGTAAQKKAASKETAFRSSKIYSRVTSQFAFPP